MCKVCGYIKQQESLIRLDEYLILPNDGFVGQGVNFAFCLSSLIKVVKAYQYQHHETNGRNILVTRKTDHIPQNSL